MRNVRVRWGKCSLLAALGLMVVLGLAGLPPAKPATRLASGVTVLIDPGHGGRDQGACGPTGIQEEPVVLAIANNLRELLEQEGVAVFMTRETDTDLAGPGEGPRKPRDMRQRVALAEEHHADVVVSLHANAVPNPRWSGAQVFYNSDKFTSSRFLAETIQAELARLVGGTNRQASDLLDHYILKESPVPAVTVEVGFLSNPREEKLLASSAHQRSLAWAIFVGLMRFFGEGGLAL